MQEFADHLVPQLQAHIGTLCVKATPSCITQSMQQAPQMPTISNIVNKPNYWHTNVQLQLR